MKKFEFLEHKADLKIKAFGETKEKLFLNMLLGMEASLRSKTRDEKDKQEIKITSLDLEALLVDFLSHVLYLNHINQAIYTDIKIKKLTDLLPNSEQIAELEGDLIGQKVESFGEEIKAVTHHDLSVIQKDDGTWEAIILFDI